MTCRVPTSRLDEILRDAEADLAHSVPARIVRLLVPIALAGLSAGVANELADSTAAVVVTTVAGLLVGYVLVWMLPIAKAMRDPRRADHWRTSLYQSEPGTVEFDLWSECDHEISDLRAVVVEPSGTNVESELAIPVRHLQTNESRGIGNHPQRFVNASPMVAGAHYTVIWYGRRTPKSAWMELGRFDFAEPLPTQKVVQERLSVSRATKRVRRPPGRLALRRAGTRAS